MFSCLSLLNFLLLNLPLFKFSLFNLLRLTLIFLRICMIIAFDTCHCMIHTKNLIYKYFQFFLLFRLLQHSLFSRYLKVIKVDFFANSEVIQYLIFLFLMFRAYLDYLLYLVFFVCAAINMSSEHVPK